MPSHLPSAFEINSRKLAYQCRFPVVGLMEKQSILGMGESFLPDRHHRGRKKPAAGLVEGYAAIGLPGINTEYKSLVREEITKPAGQRAGKAIARGTAIRLQALDTGREESHSF